MEVAVHVCISRIVPTYFDISPKTNNHLFQYPKQPQCLCRIQSIIDNVQDKLDQKLYHLLKNHLTAYIRDQDLFSITATVITYKHKVSCTSIIPRSSL